MKQLLNAITCNEPKRLIKPVFWNALANLSNLLPFLCLAYIVSQIYEYFVSGTLNRTSLWVAWGVMLACFVVTWIFENIVLDGELRETQTTDYFSKHRRSDCAVRELTAR